MPTVSALNNLNIRVHVHTKGQMPKQVPLPGLDFTHTRMHPQIQSIEITAMPSEHGILPFTPAFSHILICLLPCPVPAKQACTGRVAGLDNPKEGTLGKLPISVTLQRSTASDLFLCELYTDWFLVCFRALFLADSDN